MCGRFVIKLDDDFYYRYEIEQILEIESNYNVTPFTNIPVITKNSPKQIQFMYWGFHPSWSKELNPKYAVINTRAETITEKTYFKESIENNRCLIPITGFYEWKKVGKSKYPYYFFDKEKKYLSLAGIFSEIKDKEGNNIKTCSIITTNPNKMVENVHSRMPVILAQSEEEIWLDKSEKMKTILSLLDTYQSKTFDYYEVSKEINNTKNNSIENLKPVDVIQH